MQNKPLRMGPVALTNTLTTNILNCAISSLTGATGVSLTQPYVLLKHIRITNKTGGAVTVSLWIGATGANAAGTEFAFQGKSVPANDSIDWYGSGNGVRLDSTDFLVGGASANTSLSFEAEGEVGFS